MKLWSLLWMREGFVQITFIFMRKSKTLLKKFLLYFNYLGIIFI